MVQQGDIVRFLNAVGGGRVARIAGGMAYVEDEDGFETPVLLRECVVVRTAAQAAADKPKSSAFKGKTADRQAHEAAVEKARAEHTSAPKPVTPAAPEPVTLSQADIAETEGGDILNVTLGFEATDIKRLSASHYEASLVNDSNYYLYFTLLTRADDEDEWTDRYDGIVEPNIQVHLDTYSNADVARFDFIAVQLIAFKRERAFRRQAPVCTEFKADTTKFFKLHCFKPSPYFDTPAITFDIVRDGRPVSDETAEALAALRVACLQPDPGPQGAPEPSAEKLPDRIDLSQFEPSLRRSLRNKVRNDAKNVRKPRAAVSKSSRPGEPIEVDLHIDSLLDNTRGMSSANILNYQIDTFRQVMDENRHNHGSKIVFIHGKGDGILRQALMKELNHRYKGCHAEDASFARYGYGATEVTIK